MRKIALTLTLMLCALFISGSSGARGDRPREGHIKPLSAARETFCNTPDATPEMGIGHLPSPAAQPHERNSLATPAALSSNSFGGFVRCPANDPTNPNCTNVLQWKHATGDIGYYRDVIFAATTLISNAVDGDQWRVTFTRPSGSELSLGPVVYVDNCFYFPDQEPICRGSSIKIYWYFESQCDELGQWRFEAQSNQGIFATIPFTFKPQLGPPGEIVERFTPSAQIDYPEAPYGGICHIAGERVIFPCSLQIPFQIPWTIEKYGCALITANAILNYHGVVSDPVTLNAWLLEHGHYTSGGELWPEGLVAYAQAKGVAMSIIGGFKGDELLDGSICKFGPQSVRVLNNTHSVVATGMDDERETFTFWNSKDGIFRNLSDFPYNKHYDHYYLYAGPKHTFIDDRSSFTIDFHSPVEAFVVDPLGRRKGLDPRTGVSYDEIPDAFYGEFSTIGPEIPDGYESPKLLDLRRPVEGTYTLSVVGTGEGTYDAGFRMYDRSLGRSQKEFLDIATAPGVVHTYQIEFSKAPGSQLVMTGGFDGGGQRPRDVNKFLSYAQPVATSTALPAGTISYPLLVFFNQTVIPSTFRAQLNGVDITSLFSPSPGSGQTIMLALQKGRNVLQLSVNGNLPNRVATDTDRLVFDVP